MRFDFGALARCARDGLTGVSVCRGKAAHLPYGAITFDAIFMSITLELFEAHARQPILEECRCLLKSDGRICVVALARPGKANLISRLYDRARQAFPRFIDCQPISVHAEVAGAGLHVTQVVETAVWGLPVEIVLANQEF